MAEDSGVNDQPGAKSAGPRSKRALVRAIAVALLMAAAVGGIWMAHSHGAFAALCAKLLALPQSPNWDWWVGGLFALLGLIGVLVLWKVPQWQVARVEGLDSKERFEERNEARKTLATILGGVALLTGGYFTWRNFALAQESLRVSEQGQITDRYTKAIEQLGAVDSGGKPKLEVRLGAIYSLEAIANESRSFHWPIMEVLCTYVRMNGPGIEGESEAKRASVAIQQRQRGMMAPPSNEYPRADIQAILIVLTRRRREYDPANQSLDLSRTDFAGVNLNWVHLEGVYLKGADFTGADLRDANLSGADLYEAHFDAADLTAADLTDADLRDAILIGADLGAARLRDAILLGADLDGADLDSEDLTQDQINDATGNDKTYLREGLCLPRNWDGVTADTANACRAPK